MTGHALGRAAAGDLRVVAEARSVNGRFLKVSLRLPPAVASREAELEGLVKERVRRGTVNLSVQIERTSATGLVSVNEDVARAYQVVFRRLGLAEESIPLLPGVVGAAASSELGDDDWAAVQAAVRESVEGLVAMREREGAALGRVLSEHGARMSALRERVVARVPVVVRELQDRLKERVDLLLRDAGTTLDQATLAREVAVIADRADVTEETHRLASHLEQLSALVSKGGEVGRTLDFLAQELLREVNTLGSKSSDAELARLVIELKSEVERLKEQVANVE